jgi:hypothetical protein
VAAIKVTTFISRSLSWSKNKRPLPEVFRRLGPRREP